MDISVVIPVYNAEKYVRSAVESALRQAETAEILLVEDNSPDNALEVCKRLESQEPKVRLFRHPNGENRGAAESRNLGIIHASNKYIAFLDADDYYLDNRFAKTAEILNNNPAIDGVYEAVGAEFENKEAKRRYFSTHVDEIATVGKGVLPEDLYHYLIAGKAGYIHLNGLVVKKSGLLKVGLLPELRLHQDMILCIKLAAMLTLVAGNIDNPIAVRRCHLENRITNPNTDYSRTRFNAYKNLLQWTRAEELPLAKQQLVRHALWKQGYRACKNARNYPMALYYYVLTHLLIGRNA